MTAGASDIDKIVKQNRGASDVREDKVAEMKQRIASGAYQVMGEKAAGDLMKETLQNNTLLYDMDNSND